MYLLDTCILIDLIRGRSSVQNSLSKIGLHNCCTAETCIAELYVGAYKTQSKLQFQQIEWLESKLTALPLSGSLRTYAQIRALLEQKGLRIEDTDLFIAAVALDHDLTLVTHNTRHFARIPGLSIEDWCRPQSQL